MAEPFFRTPFALEGDQEAIPEALQSTGDVSFQTGYGFDYERDPESDPSAKDIERPKMNWLFGAITRVLRQYQTYGAFPYITPEQNNGTAFPYEKGARCVYGSGSSIGVYESLETNNMSLPTDATKWARVNVADFVPNTRKISVSGGLTGGGTLDKDVTIGVTIPSSVPPTRKINTTSPLVGGGALSADLTLDLNTIPVSKGGTGETTVAAARNALGLGNTAGAVPVANGGTGRTAAPSMLTNLASTAAASPLEASPRPGVTGTLPLGNGGTGATTASTALAALSGATKPKTASGVGQWLIRTASVGKDYTLPAGGTWAYFLFVCDTSLDTPTGVADVMRRLDSVGVAAGGTTLATGITRYYHSGLCWRIA